MFKKFLVFFLLLGMVCSSAASADKLCLKSVVNKRGKIKHTTKVVPEGSACPKRFVPLLDNEASDSAVAITGPQGPQGEQGLQGPQGLQGTPGYAGITLEFGYSANNSDSPKVAYANCPSGKSVIGGHGGVIEGFGVAANQTIAISYASVPILSNSFAVRAYETTAVGSNWQVVSVAMCVPQD